MQVCKFVPLELFLKNFWRTWVLFVGPLIPLFWTSGDVCPGFQSQGGSLVCMLPCLHTTDASDSQVSGVTPADLLVASKAANCVSNMRVAEVGFDQETSHTVSRHAIHLAIQTGCTSWTLCKFLSQSPLQGALSHGAVVIFSQSLYAICIVWVD